LVGSSFSLRQPRVIGEILAGVVLGPAVVGQVSFASGLAATITNQRALLEFVYWLGLLLLSFLSGAETRQLFSREERRRKWLG
jgi:K+:H+ antiporter